MLVDLSLRESSWKPMLGRASLRLSPSHERRAGRPWDLYDQALKGQAITFVHSGMSGKDIADMLWVSSAAVACNWVRAAESPKPTADRTPVNPIRNAETRAYIGFEGLRGLHRPTRAEERHPALGGKSFKSREIRLP